MIGHVDVKYSFQNFHRPRTYPKADMPVYRGFPQNPFCGQDTLHCKACSGRIEYSSPIAWDSACKLIRKTRKISCPIYDVHLSTKIDHVMGKAPTDQDPRTKHSGLAAQVCFLKEDSGQRYLVY